MKIGNIEVGRLALGPMAGITDMPFRLLCKEQGADLIYSEMVSAKGIHYNNKNHNLQWKLNYQTGLLALMKNNNEMHSLKLKSHLKE